MLNKNKILNVLFLALLFTLSAVAQNSKTENNTDQYRQGGWWTFGINGGASYQTSDVCSTYDGWGLGLTLAKNVYYRPNAPLAFDLRGRFLYANQKGQDWERSYGLERNIALNGTDNRDFNFGGSLNYLNNPALTSDSFYYANHRTDLVELGLEGVINLNRLKEKTNVIVNLYGGLNVDWYKTRIDQANDMGGLAGSEYDYSMIPTGDKATAISALESQRDYSYETVADGFNNEYGTFTWMPSAGVELGYQLTPKFSIIGGHKVTWSRDDIMDGQKWNNDNTASTNNDIYHYTHLGLRWIIDPYEATMEPPIIKIIRPRPLPHSTQTAYATVKAEIENVSSAADVSCTFNGNTYNAFAFNPRSEDFSTTLNLVPGRNVLVITATNMAGQDTEDVVIIYNEPTTVPTPDKTPPVVKITKPSRPGTKVSSPSYKINANIKHVNARSDVKVYLNGSSVSNFTYSVNTDKLESPLTLQIGKNTIRVTGKNKDGSDSDETVIIYEKEEAPCPNPVVSISNISNPRGTANPNLGKSTVTAVVRNVSNKSDIKMYVNGDRTTDFSFNRSTGGLSATIIVGRGRNMVRIVATTECGKDEDKESITYNATTPTNPTNPTYPPTNPTPVQQPPIVDISSPNNGISTNNSRVNLVASVKHVTRKNQIRMTLNGVTYNNFSYSTSTKRLTANNVPLRVGTNTLEVKATNSAGTDSDDVLVIRNDNTPPPPPPTCPEPTVKIDNISTPAPTLSNPNVGKSTLYASTTHVSNKNQIQLYVNGRRMTNFSFNTSTGKITAAIDMQKGSNSIKVIVTTTCGTDQATESTSFQGASTPKPVVNIVKPSSNAVFTTPTTNLSVTVLNVTSKNDIKVKINGKNTTNFNFNSGTNNVSATVNLQEGNNTIFVSATNAAGTDSDSETVKYTKPAQPKPPVVNINKPSNGATVNTNKVELKATVLNVTKKSDVTVKLNNNVISNFTFSRSTVSAQLNVKEGNNTIQVIGKNKDGQDQKSVTVKYVKPATAKPPTVTITSPARNVTVNNSKFNLKATLVNVKAKKDITLLVNGKKITAFVYNVRAGKLAASIALKPGKNTVVVTGKNTAGTDSDTKTIIYKNSTPAKPTIKITNVSSPAPTLSNPNVGKSTVMAKTTLVTTKSNIEIKVNGQILNSFTFNPRKGEIVANVSFNKGNNKLVITVKNKNGSAKVEETVSY